MSDWFELDRPSPYMSIVAPVRGAVSVPDDEQDREEGEAPPPPDEVADLAGRLAGVRSPVPAVTHVNGSARIQTVDPERYPELERTLRAFLELTGCPVLVNTSFNVRGEPIVADAEDAYRCFMTTDMDALVVGERLYAKADQPPWTGGEAPTVDD